MKRRIVIFLAATLAVCAAIPAAEAARRPARTITLYDQDGFQGYKRVFNGVVWNLERFNFSNVAHSLKAQGYWQVCTSANFRGTCKIVRGDLRDLNEIGMSSRISSVRPIDPPR